MGRIKVILSFFIIEFIASWQMEALLSDTSYEYTVAADGNSAKLLTLCGEATLKGNAESSVINIGDICLEISSDPVESLREIMRTFPLMRPSRDSPIVKEFAAYLLEHLKYAALLLDLQGAVNWRLNDVWGFGQTLQLSFTERNYPSWMRAAGKEFLLQTRDDFLHVLQFYIQSRYDSMIKTMIRNRTPDGLGGVYHYIVWRLAYYADSLLVRIKRKKGIIIISGDNILAKIFVRDGLRTEVAGVVAAAGSLSELDTNLSKCEEINTMMHVCSQLNEIAELLPKNIRRLLYSRELL